MRFRKLSLRTTVFVAVALWSVSLSAETLRLATGEVLIGEVKSASFTGITMKTVFPTEAEFSLKPSQVDPASFYEAVSSRLSREDAKVRLQLAQFCLDHGLFTHAVVEARTAAKLDTGLGEKVAELEGKAVASIAERLLDEARTYMAIDNPHRARLYLRSILERYPQTASAKTAEKLLTKLPKESTRKTPASITDARAKGRLREQLKRAMGYLEKADRRVGNLDRHFRSGRDEHLLRRTAPYYGKAFTTLKRAAARPTDDEALNRELRAHFDKARSRLTKLYLELGQLYLSRGALKVAEDYCSQACLLEPEDKHLHDLHQKILDAKVSMRFGF